MATLEKPHKGTINLWRKLPTFRGIGLGYYVGGISDGHPDFNGGPIYTSYVVKNVGGEIETRNSRYTLGTKYETGEKL